MLQCDTIRFQHDLLTAEFLTDAKGRALILLFLVMFTRAMLPQCVSFSFLPCPPHVTAVVGGGCLQQVAEQQQQWHSRSRTFLENERRFRVTKKEVHKSFIHPNVQNICIHSPQCLIVQARFGQRFLNFYSSRSSFFFLTHSWPQPLLLSDLSPFIQSYLVFFVSFAP